MSELVMSGVVQIPVEVAAEAVVFRVLPRGYDRRQVDRHVAALEQELAELRWEHDELDAQRQALADRKAEQDRWEPSFVKLGARAAEILRLADEEAAALRAEARDEVRRRRHDAVGELEAHIAERTEALAQARADHDRELRHMQLAAQGRRELLEAELARTRRDAELEIAGRLAQATAQAQDVRSEAARTADEMLLAARAEVAHLHRRRDELGQELTDLSSRLVAVVHRLSRTDDPLEVRTG